jgi:transposase-like protein
MALDQSALLELLEALKVADADGVVRQALESVFQVLIDAEATARIGAGPHERTPSRVTQRNGYRDRLVTTAAGDVELRTVTAGRDDDRRGYARATGGCSLARVGQPDHPPAQ